ncbi:hypothetical protein BU14_0759s0006 [Porphyra umbilicalis]|uniref:Uncharacterized protein n=1 Tax=Porphyra umbilicalis TaxID=2786 RepID=A0A1X6NPC2_PORUM|nr:hypothetical protein BU14_0759s0006 [Porphyra umbilicalis]|eukprot:OSX70437.1 hypothetical protein BU14_0759s0006 [Porphyra umbilicalis]
MAPTGRLPRRRRASGAAATTAAAAAATLLAAALPAAVGGAPARPSATVPWEWAYLGGTLESAAGAAADAAADAAAAAGRSGRPRGGGGADGDAPVSDDVASWATPAGFYALLMPQDNPVATEFRLWNPSEGYWTTVGVANRGGARAGGAMPPPAVAGAATASDAAGVGGGRLWLWGGTRVAPPSRASDGLYEYAPPRATDFDRTGRWTQLAGGGVYPPPAPAACPTDAPAPCATAMADADAGAALAYAPALGSLVLATSHTGDGGAGVRLWRYGLGGAAGTGWSRIVPTGTPPAASAGGPASLTLVARGHTLYLLRRQQDGGGATELWSVPTLYTTVPAWVSMHRGTAAAAAGLLSLPFGTFDDGERFLCAYVPGSMDAAAAAPPAALPPADAAAAAAAVATATARGSRVPGLGAVPPPPPAAGRRRLADVDRWVVLDTATLAARVWEAPGLPHNETAVEAGVVPPPDGLRVLLGGSPLRQTRPTTGGALVRVAAAGEAGRGSLLVGHLGGGASMGACRGGSSASCGRGRRSLRRLGPTGSRRRGGRGGGGEGRAGGVWGVSVVVMGWRCCRWRRGLPVGAAAA